MSSTGSEFATQSIYIHLASIFEKLELLVSGVRAHSLLKYKHYSLFSLLGEYINALN